MRGVVDIFMVFIARQPAFGRGMGCLMLLCCLGGGQATRVWANPVLASLEFQPLSLENNPSVLNDIAPTESSPGDSAGGDDNEHYEDIRKYSGRLRNASHFAQIIDDNCDDSGLCLRVPWYLSFSSTAARWAYERRGAPDILERIYTASLNALSAKNPYFPETAFDESVRPGVAVAGRNAPNATSPARRAASQWPSPTVAQWAQLIGEVYRAAPTAPAAAPRVLTDPGEDDDARPTMGLPDAASAFDTNTPFNPAADAASHEIRHEGYLSRALRGFVRFMRSIRDAVGV